MSLYRRSTAEDFDFAADRVWDLPESLSSDNMLTLYGLYKQGKFGDCNIGIPPWWDFKGRKKWEAWNAVRGMPREEAQGRYVWLVKDLFERQGEEY